MNLKDLIPQHKFDIETAENLKKYSFEEIEPILPQILEWLQDGNWPVSRPVADYIISLPQHQTGPYLMEILNGKDYEWKYFVICFFSMENKDDLYPEFLSELKRLAEKPTDIEIGCELQWMAKQILTKGSKNFRGD